MIHYNTISNLNLTSNYFENERKIMKDNEAT